MPRWRTWRDESGGHKRVWEEFKREVWSMRLATSSQRSLTTKEYWTNRGGPRRNFIPPETLVLNGTAGDHGTAGRTLTQPVPGFLVR